MGIALESTEIPETLVKKSVAGLPLKIVTAFYLPAHTEASSVTDACLPGIPTVSRQRERRPAEEASRFSDDRGH